MRRYKIAQIPGDGIGPEVINAGVEVLVALSKKAGDFDLDIVSFPWGTDYYLQNKEMMPSNGLDSLRDFDAIYFGSAGDPRVPDHLSLWGLRLAICQPFEQYANVNPHKDK
jgi:tartrate dehydrogenase/decarboxylase/D-malate dehydrogenase